MNTTMARDTSRHPCFNKESAGSCGRVHLPVAPKCNIKCNYCDRRHDCVNESRPGVSSAVLGPEQALAYLDRVLEKAPNITVVGIAGPGDPMANPDETLRTLRLIKAKYPHMLFCLSSNGLALPRHVPELAELGVSHVTVTVNAVDPAVGAKIYAWARDGKVLYRDGRGAELLLSRQIESIKALKAAGILVKVNTILVPGVNDHHVEEVARTVAELGADIHNIIPMHPNADTPFADIPEPSAEAVQTLRVNAGIHLPQMTHCKRCRADAVGLLDKDLSGELSCTLQACSRLAPDLDDTRPYVAVATREGLLVNLHLGEAWEFQIWDRRDGTSRLVETREAPEPGSGPKRWERLAEILKDCRAVLAAAMGDTPRSVLAAKGITAYACSGFIEEALAAAYGAGNMDILRSRRKGVGSSCSCSGGGEGC